MIYFKKLLWVFVDYMDGKDMSAIVQEKMGDLSEEFCKWTLYQTALGLKAMHDKNVLHRDLKSDNILCNSEGVIKIADLGFSIFLSEQA